MRDRPRPKGSINAFTRCFNKYVIKKYKYKDYLGLIEFGFTDNSINLEATKSRFNLEDDGC